MTLPIKRQEILLKNLNSNGIKEKINKKHNNNLENL